MTRLSVRNTALLLLHLTAPALSTDSVDTESADSSSCSGGWMFGNPKACPQHLCYGNSVCCMGTGECMDCVDPSFICKEARICDTGAGTCGDVSVGWPKIDGDEAANHDLAHHEVDGCVCTPPVWSPCHDSKQHHHSSHFRYSGPDCWGSLECETGNSGSCHEDGLCRGNGGNVAAEGDFCWFKGNTKSFTFCGVPEEDVLSTTVTTTMGGTDLICDMNCYEPAAEAVNLEGSIGSGDSAYVPGLTEEECIAACQAEPTCEAVVYDTIGLGCFGRKHLTLADTGGGCQHQPGYVTITMAGRPALWGKCSILGDPHITTFDSLSLVGGYTDFGRVISIYDAGLFGLVSSSDIIIQARFGYTQEYTQASSLIGLAMAGPLIGGKTLSVGIVNPDSTPYYDGWAMYYGTTRILTTPGTWTSPDSLVSVSLAQFNPGDYCSGCRAPVSTELTPFAYVIHLGNPYNVQVYLLPGKSISNAVITMRRVVGQDGLCGNFNCEKSDDTSEHIVGGEGYPYTDGTDLFPSELAPPENWDVQSGKSREDALNDCPENVKVTACGARDSSDRWDACAFDSCMAYADNPQLRATMGMADVKALSKAQADSIMRPGSSWLSAPMAMVLAGSFAAVGLALFARRQLAGSWRAASLPQQPDTLLACVE